MKLSKERNYRHQIASMHVKSYYNNDTTEIILKKSLENNMSFEIELLIQDI